MPFYLKSRLIFEELLNKQAIPAAEDDSSFLKRAISSEKNYIQTTSSERTTNRKLLGSIVVKDNSYDRRR
jgi:hypothetical protein